MPSKSKIFLAVCVSFIAGIFLGRYINFEIMAILAMIFVVIGTLGWSRPKLRLLGFLGLALVAGVWRMDAASGPAARADWGKTEFSGTVCEEPDKRTDKTLLTLCQAKAGETELPYKVLVTAARFPEFSYGDRLKGFGKVQEPKAAEASGEFSYRDYLSRFNIAAVVYFPKLEKEAGGQGNRLKLLLLKFKQSFITRLGDIVPEPENSFLAGLLVGAKRGIPDDLMQAFSDTGTTHIVAISGFNITIIAWALDKLLRRFGRRVSFALSLLSIVLFVVLTGASSSVVRAGIMGSLLLVALNIGRLYAITNALALTAVVMLAVNPKLLLFDVGFQLSFLSLMGLVYLAPRLEPLLAGVPRAIRVLLVATVSAQVFTLPLLLYNFDRLSLVSPAANVLVLPLVPWAMLAGFLTGALAFVSPYLALPAAWATWFLLTVIIRIVTELSRLPFAAVSVGIPAWFIGVYYGTLCLALWAAAHPGIFAKMKIWKPAPNA